MPLKVDICETVLEEMASWSLPTSVYSWLLKTIQADLSTRLSASIGDVHSVAPVFLRRYSLSFADESGDLLHKFVFIVGDERQRRVVWRASYRTGGAE